MKKTNEKSTNAWWRPALFLFARLSAWVLFPVIAATFIGHWLDKKYDIAPFGLIGVVGAAFILSMAGIVREAGKEYKQIFKDNENKSGKPNG